jgi:hypothetical protein
VGNKPLKHIYRFQVSNAWGNSIEVALANDTNRVTLINEQILGDNALSELTAKATSLNVEVLCNKI